MQNPNVEAPKFLNQRKRFHTLVSASVLLLLLLLTFFVE